MSILFSSASPAAYCSSGFAAFAVIGRRRGRLGQFDVLAQSVAGGQKRRVLQAGRIGHEAIVDLLQRSQPRVRPVASPIVRRLAAFRFLALGRLVRSAEPAWPPAPVAANSFFSSSRAR